VGDRGGRKKSEPWARPYQLGATLFFVNRIVIKAAAQGPLVAGNIGAAEQFEEKLAAGFQRII